MALFLATAVLLTCAGWSRILERSWGAPGAFFALVWAVGAAPAAIVLAEDVTPEAMLFVASFVVAVLVGSQLAAGGGAITRLHVRNGQHVKAGPSKCKNLTLIVALLGVCGFGASVGYVWDAGYSLSQLKDGSTWLDLAVHYSVARYSGTYLEPLPIRVFFAANYAGGILGGVLLAGSRGFASRLSALLPVMAGSLITVITTAKTPMLLTGLFSIAGWLSLKSALRSDSIPRRSVKQSLAIAVLACVLAVISVASLILRYGTEGTDVALIFGRSLSYIFGHMPALSAWLSVENWNQLKHTWGTLTFAGVAEFLGLSTRTPGFYDPIGLNSWSAESNISTAFRGAVTDFGIFGAWFVAILLGAFGRICYERLRSGKATASAIVGLAFFYTIAGWSLIVSILAYNVVLLAGIISYALLVATRTEIGNCVEWPLAGRGQR